MFLKFMKLLLESTLDLNLHSDKFTMINNLKNKIGRIPIDKLNNYGGS